MWMYELVNHSTIWTAIVQKERHYRIWFEGSVGHVWVRKKIRRNIYKKKGWHSAFLKAFFTNRWFAPVLLITPSLRAKMPAATVRQSTTGRCEFVKNAFKKCSCCHPFFLINISSYLLSDSYKQNTIQTTTQSVCFTV